MSKKESTSTPSLAPESTPPSSRPERLSEKIVGPKGEAELLKKIAEHEVYSTAYKLKLAAIVGKKAAVLAGKGAVLAGKGMAVVGKQAAKGIQKAVKAAKAGAEEKRRDW